MADCQGADGIVDIDEFPAEVPKVMVFLDLCSGDVEKGGRNRLSHRLLMFILAGQEVNGAMFGSVFPGAMAGGLPALSIGFGEGSLTHEAKLRNFNLDFLTTTLQLRQWSHGEPPFYLYCIPTEMKVKEGILGPLQKSDVHPDVPHDLQCEMNVDTIKVIFRFRQ